MNDQALILWAEQAIRLYLNQHPGAADTLEGIHGWWVGWQEGTVASPSLTKEALLRLEAAGKVVQYRKGRHTMWRRSSGQ